MGMDRRYIMCMDITIFKVSKKYKNFTYKKLSDYINKGIAKDDYKKRKNPFMVAMSLKANKEEYFRLAELRKCYFVLHYFDFHYLDDMGKYIEIKEKQLQELLSMCDYELKNRKKFEDGKIAYDCHKIEDSEYDNLFYCRVKMAQSELKRILRQPVKNGSKYFIEFDY